MKSYFVLYIVIILLYGATWTSAQTAPAEAEIWLFSAGAVTRFSSTGTVLETISAACATSSNDAVVGPDGFIWYSTGGTLQRFNIESKTCGTAITVPGVSGLTSVQLSYGKKYLYYVGNGDIRRMSFNGTYTHELVLAKTGSVAYIAIGFQNGVIYSSKDDIATTDNQIFEVFDYSEIDDSIVLPAASSYQWDPSPYSYHDRFRKFRKCPVSSATFCGQPTVAGGQWIMHANPDGTSRVLLLDTYSPTFIGSAYRDYWTAPWGLLYSTVQTSGVYWHNYTDGDVSSIAPNSFATGSYYSIAGFIQAPSVTISNTTGCSAAVSYPSYSWVTKAVLQLKSDTGAFDDDLYTDLSATDGPVQFDVPVTCDTPTNSFRVWYQGNAALSEGVYSRPVTVSCQPCLPEPPVSPPLDPPAAPVVPPVTPVAPPVVPPASQFIPNVIPILECIEPVDSGFVVHLGYNNTELFRVNISVGELNRFTVLDNRGQPTEFRTGRTSFYPTAEFSLTLESGALSWLLSRYALDIDTLDTQVYCPSSAYFSLSFFRTTAPTEEDIEAIRLAIAAVLEVTETRVRVIRWTTTPVSGKRSGDGNIVDLENEISAAPPGSDEPSASEAVQDMIETAKNQTTMEQVIDPNDEDPNSAMLGAETLPTGVEKPGKEVTPVTPQSTPIVTSGSSLVTRSVYFTPAVIFIAIRMLYLKQ